MGRMGQQLIKSSKINKNFKLISLTEYKILNKRILGIRPTTNNEEAFKKTNVIIDFTIQVDPVGAVNIDVKLVVLRSALTFLYKFAINIVAKRP